jgi:hypothetical protein
MNELIAFAIGAIVGFVANVLLLLWLDSRGEWGKYRF